MNRVENLIGKFYQGKKIDVIVGTFDAGFKIRLEGTDELINISDDEALNIMDSTLKIEENK